MALENFRYTLYPLGTQIAISYVAAKHTKSHAQIGFVASLACFSVPITLVVIANRLSASDEFLFMEMWLNCSVVLQALFFFVVEARTAFPIPLWFCLFVVFMNEVTFHGGDGFGHRVITCTSGFFVAKILAAAAFRFLSQNVWAALVLGECVTMGVLTLVTVWVSPSVAWFVPMFLVAIPVAFPTSNMWIPPTQEQEGWLGIAPAQQLII